MKNLFTLLALFFTVSLFSQQIRIVRSTTGGTGGNGCYVTGDKLGTYELTSPYQIPSGINIHSGSATSIIRNFRELGRETGGQCSPYIYRFELLLGSDVCTVSNNNYAEFNLYVGNLCLADYIAQLPPFQIPPCFNNRCLNNGLPYLVNVNPCTGCHLNRGKKKLGSLSVNEKSPDNTIPVWPNPFSEQLNFSASNDLEMVQLFDISGRLIDLIRITNEEDVKTVNTSNLESGMYVLSMHFIDGSSKVQKIIKE